MTDQTASQELAEFLDLYEGHDHPDLIAHHMRPRQPGFLATPAELRASLLRAVLTELAEAKQQLLDHTEVWAVVDEPGHRHDGNFATCELAQQYAQTDWVNENGAPYDERFTWHRGERPGTWEMNVDELPAERHVRREPIIDRTDADDPPVACPQENQ